ncbi:MAG TPA: hypothetical protein VK121_05205 [Pseudogracilibacillus sp.]|nr:hypothetical protein [Pseudogracilibacillus sp.]
MSGLECSEVNISAIKNDGQKFRIDSEYYKKTYQKAYKTVMNLNYIKMEDVTNTLTDFHANGSYSTIARNFKLLDEENYAYMIRSTDLEKRDFEVDVKYIDEHAYHFLSKSKLYGGEVLINKIGTPGKTYIMPHLNRKSSLGMNLFMLSSKIDQISNEYIYAYLNSKIGKQIISRHINGAVPLTIDKDSINNLVIPVFSKHFNNVIKSGIKDSEILFQQSVQTYKLAEQLLLKKLNYDKLKKNESNVSIKNLSESFLDSGRLDPEYYEPRYDDLLNLIKENKYKRLNDIVDIRQSIEPGSMAYESEGIPFVRVSNLSKYEITPTSIFLNKEDFPVEDLKPKKDTILLSKDGSCGIAYKVDENMDIITSKAIIHLDITDSGVLPEYLALVLNSIITQMQAKRDAGGSVIKHWKIDEIKNILIPILSLDIQKELEENIKESYKLRNKSKEIVEYVTESFNIAIKSGEEKALEYIEKVK